MPTFQYRAKKKSGETVYGSIEAQSEDEAIELMNRQDLVPVSLESKTQTERSAAAQRILPQGKIASKHIALFTRQLANLIKSGISILRALVLLSEQTSNKALRGLILEVEQKVRGGKTFSASLADYPKTFNSFFVAMVRAGEESGNLKEVLIRLAEHTKREEEISAKVRSALAYPVLMAAVGLGTIIFILVFVMPRITGLFTSVGEELPMATKILMGVSGGLRAGGIWILAAVIAGIFFLMRWSSSTAGRRTISTAGLRLPLYGNFILKADLARFCRTLELLLKSGIPIVRGLEIAVPVLGNEILKEEIISCQRNLVGGASFAEGFKASALVPSTMADLIVVGEESGLLEEVLGDVASTYEQETNDAIKTLTTLLEPLMILIVGSVVGFIVIAMLLPIFQIDVLVK